MEKSTSWAQDLPLLADDGHSLLNQLENMLTKKEALSRKKAFAKCRNVIDESRRNGGIKIMDMGKPLIKSYPNGYKERVDIEVHFGIAFVDSIES